MLDESLLIFSTEGLSPSEEGSCPFLRIMRGFPLLEESIQGFEESDALVLENLRDCPVRPSIIVSPSNARRGLIFEDSLKLGPKSILEKLLGNCRVSGYAL